ncbi:MAG: hypothetical protein J0H01_22615 [Rhizobiales bacterium]|nr:hypothetical protein [Hyphomicrobiales bacterium]
MAYLVSSLWPWVAAAIVLGVLVGAVTGRPPAAGEARKTGLAASLLVWALAAVLVVGIAAAVSHWLRGRHGLWLDIALVLTIAYLAGCGAGSLLRRLAGGSGGQVEQPAPAAVMPVVPAEVPVPAAPAIPAEIAAPATAGSEPLPAEPPLVVAEPAKPARTRPQKPRDPKPKPGLAALPEPVSRSRRAADAGSAPAPAKPRKPRGKPKA